MGIFKDLLEGYRLRTTADYETALREILQEICLLGLWRGKFFEHAAFYGGTALRLFHNLNRFSEDLDFSLLRPGRDFHLKDYFIYVRQELEGFGLRAEIEEKKTGQVESAFIKADTRALIITASAPDEMAQNVHPGRLLKVKFEIDTDPPGGFETETRYLFRPIPFSVKLYKPSSLFAGKMHALLGRQWKGRVKGRDWYDFLFYITKDIPLNLEHLRRRLVQTGHVKPEEDFSPGVLKTMLIEAIDRLDLEQALKDVRPFIADAGELEAWSKGLFLAAAERIRAE